MTSSRSLFHVTALTGVAAFLFSFARVSRGYVLSAEDVRVDVLTSVDGFPFRHVIPAGFQAPRNDWTCV